MENWQFTPYVIIYLIVGGIAFLLSFLAWQIKTVKGSRVLSYTFLSVGIWVTAYIIEISSTNFLIKQLAIKAAYFGIVGAVYFWFVFVVIYTNYKFLLKKRVFVLFAIIPIITLLLAFTFNHHSFFYVSYQWEYIDKLLFFSQKYGPSFYLWMGYAYFVIITSFFIAFVQTITLPKKFRKQLVPIAASVVLLLIPNFMLVLGLNPLYPYDPTTIFFVLVGIIVIYSIYFQHFLNVMPIAHNLVLKNAKMGIIVVDNSNRILEVNPSAKRMIGKQIDDLIGQDLLEYMPEYQEVEEGLLKQDNAMAEIQLGHSNATYQIKIAPLSEQGQRAAGRLIMLWDITEMKTALIELDAYAHTVAHDLKTPLSQIIGFADILQHTTPNDKEYKRMATYIVDGGKRMNVIIEELLKLSEIRSVSTFNAETINMGTIVDSALLRFCEDEVSMVKKPDNWPMVSGNKVWLEEVWANLISNAIKYGGQPPKINLGFAEHQTGHVFWVQDNGQGMTKEEQKQLFSKFSRLNRHERKIKGHGLGLSIVQRVIKKLGGEVWVKSQPGEGSTFYFSVPLILD